MKREREDFERLIAELQWDREQLVSLAEMNQRALARIEAGAQDELDYSALGYTIHNLYGVMENACFRIAKFFENGLSNHSWHRELLERMLLEIPDLRPAFFTRQEYLLVDQLRAFRHVFRNLYSRPIDPERIHLLQHRVPSILAAFHSALNRYLPLLQGLSERVEE